MRRVLASSVCLFALLGLSPAFADEARVIAGIYPAAQPHAPVRSDDAEEDATSGLGGGFVEMLLTGDTKSVGAARRRYARPAPAVAAYAPTAAVAVNAPTAAVAAYAPTAADSISGPYGTREAVDREDDRQVYASVAAPDSDRAQAEPPEQFQRQEVDYATAERPGVLVIDTRDKYLYLVEPGGRAMRYGVGVGRPGFEWAGVKSVTRKAEWPDWTPPPDMMKRRPDLPAHMDGGPENPLGARALYLGSSMYRIHGTNEPWTIGQNVSSGCIRMMNKDVIDLYERVKVGAKVIVI